MDRWKKKIVKSKVFYIYICVSISKLPMKNNRKHFLYSTVCVQWETNHRLCHCIYAIVYNMSWLTGICMWTCCACECQTHEYPRSKQTIRLTLIYSAILWSPQFKQAYQHYLKETLRLSALSEGNFKIISIIWGKLYNYQYHLKETLQLSASSEGNFEIISVI